MLTNIPSATLQQLVRLSKRKDALMVEIQNIEREMVRLQSKLERSPKTVGHPGRLTISRKTRTTRAR
jgi:hypothetical protein